MVMMFENKKSTMDQARGFPRSGFNLKGGEDMKRIYVGAIVLALILVLAYSALAHGQAVVQGPVPWVSRIQGDQDSMLVRQTDTDWYEGTINTPFGEGDMVWQDKGGRSEIYIDRGSFIRLDSNSGLVFDRLHDREVRMAVTKGRAEAGNGQNRLMLVDLPGHTLIVPPGAKNSGDTILITALVNEKQVVFFVG